MWLPLLPLIGVGLLTTLTRGDSPTNEAKISCGDNSHEVEPPMFVHIVRDEAHFRCASGYQLVGNKIVACTSDRWTHELPKCRELPKTTLKMKCPYNHGVWSLQNLDLIANWISLNEDNVLILDREFIGNSVDSQRLASAMIERMNDPFFRFFGKMATNDKASLDTEEVIQRFKDSAEFRRLSKKLREEDPYFDLQLPLDSDSDEEVLKRYYGRHYREVLADRILPYDDSVRELAKTLPELPKVENKIKNEVELPMPEIEKPTIAVYHADQPDTGISLNEMVANDVLQELSYRRENGSPELVNEELGQSIDETHENILNPTVESSSRKTKRARGDSERLLPPRSRTKDYFNRDLNQILEGTKADLQEANLRNSYLSHLMTVIKHIIKYNIPKHSWPEFLQNFDLQDLTMFLESRGERPPIPSPQPQPPSPPQPPRPLLCPRPWDLGFEMIHRGSAFLDPTGQILYVQCNEGYTLRGPGEMYCDNGRWVTRENRMPTCEEAGVRPSPVECEPLPPNYIRNGRAAYRPGMPRDRILIECNPGHTLRGNPELFCDRGRWMPTSGRMPSCDYRSTDICMSRPPDAPVYGSVTEPHYLTDRDRTVVVRFMCNPGYGLHGMDYSKCDGGTWAPLAPVCVANGTDEIPHNDEMPQSPSYCPNIRIVGGRLHFYEEAMPKYARLSCAAGYKLQGQPKIMCKEDGTWQQPLPNCIDQANNAIDLTTCSRIQPPVNGEVDQITPTAARFRCNPGFRMEGRDQITCYRGQWRGEAPRCIPETAPGECPESPVRAQNAIVFTYTDGRWYECAQNYTMSGSNVQLCRGGHWDPEPTCALPPGSSWHISSASIVYPRIPCPLPPRSEGLTVIPRNDKVYYRCRPGEQLVGRNITECVGGRWQDPQPPRCLRMAPPPPQPQPQPPTPVRPIRPSPPAPLQRCRPQRIRGGDAYVYSEGRVVYYQCNTNYMIRGATSLRCENSRWSHPLPQCIPLEGNTWPMEDGEIFYESMKCHQPVNEANSFMTIYDNGLRLVYTCMHSQTPIERSCLPDSGQWIGPLPNCRTMRGVCEPQEIDNGRFYQYGDDVGYIQCNHGFVIENNPYGLRNQQAYCRQSTGVWEFGPRPPRCVPDSRPDNRPQPLPIDSRIGEMNNTRFQIDECAPPQVSSDYTWYIQGEGKQITLGCKGRSRRSAGSLKCDQGKWLHEGGAFKCREEEITPGCSLGGRTIQDGSYFIYNENHYVFQCNKHFRLEGQAMAVCPGYEPEYSKNIPILDENFDLPVCVRDTNDLREHFYENNPEHLDRHSEGRECLWPEPLADSSPSEYLISEGGRLVVFRCPDSKKSIQCKGGEWRGDDLACLERQHQQVGCDDRLPDEPVHGTYFQYQDNRRGTRMFYFQCNTGYTVRGPKTVPCTSGTPFAPVCESDYDPQSRELYKERNPEPLTIVQCQEPPEAIPGGYILIQSSGERVEVRCKSGYVIAGTNEGRKIVTCSHQAEQWSSQWPRCVPLGDSTPLRDRDPFGRVLPQVLEGQKAALQSQLLREQFLDHVRQMVDFRTRNAQRLRSQGFNPGQLPPPDLPILPNLPPDVLQVMERTYADIYREGRQALISNLERRQRGRRKIHVPAPDAPTPPVVIPSSLQSYTKDIVENKLSQSDVDTLSLMPDKKLIVQFIEERRKGIHKSKDDPIQSQKFLSQVLGAKSDSKPPASNVIEQLKQHVEPLPSAAPLKGHHSSVTPTLENTTATEPVTKTEQTESPASLSEISSQSTSTTANLSDLIKETTPIPDQVSMRENTTETLESDQPINTDSADIDDEFAEEDIDQIEDADDKDLVTDGNSTESSKTEMEENINKDSTTASIETTKMPEAKPQKKPKKGYDTSCALLNNKAPEIDNGFVLSYELIDATDSQMLRVTYRCNPDFRFRYDHTSSLLCRLGQWKGDVPECIPDEEDEEDDDE